MEKSVGDSRPRSEEEGKPPSTKLTIKLKKNPETAISKGKEVVCSTRSITCTLCNKPFSSVKALHGHMRCHPKRNWRGMNAPESSTSSRPITTYGWPAELRRGRRTCAVVGSCSSIKVDEDEEKLAIGAACGLMLLATGDDRNKIPLPPKHDDSRKRKLVVEDATTNDEEGDGVHVCKIRDKAFPSGQALGGHMRLHYQPPSAQDQVMRPALCLDLNQIPAEDSEEEEGGYGDAS